jgi:NADH:ubiquinone oxidoreductase subunit E
MIELKTIAVCQAPMCQEKGSKTILLRLHEQYAAQFQSVYPNLQITGGDCQGECETGPNVRVNDQFLLKEVDKDKAKMLLENPDILLGEIQHVQEKDQETFQRIVSGELY